MDFFSFPLVELTVAQFSFLSILYLLFSGLILYFMDSIVSFISNLIRGVFKHDKD